MRADPALRLAVQQSTYESDFSAITQMLDECQPVFMGECGLFRWGDAYLLTSNLGVHCHLIREYAIHHFLYCQYGAARPA